MASGGLLINVGNIVAQVLLLGVAVVALSDDLEAGKIPTSSIVEVLLIAIVVIAIGLGVLFGVPKVRKMVMPPIKSASATMWAAARSPRRVAQLLGGNIVNALMYAAVMEACLEAFGGSINFWTLLVDQHLHLDDRVARADPRRWDRGLVGGDVGRARRGRDLERGGRRGGAREPAGGELHPRGARLVGHQRPPPRRLPLTSRSWDRQVVRATSAASGRSGGESSAQCDVGIGPAPSSAAWSGRRIVDHASRPPSDEDPARDHHRVVEAVREVDRVPEVRVADPGQWR